MRIWIITSRAFLEGEYFDRLEETKVAKTYGTRLLNRGVRLETVSKCLGHSSTQITQAAYAKLLKHTIIDEVKMAFK